MEIRFGSRLDLQPLLWWVTARVTSHVSNLKAMKERTDSVEGCQLLSYFSLGNWSLPRRPRSLALGLGTCNGRRTLLRGPAVGQTRPFIHRMRKHSETFGHASSPDARAGHEARLPANSLFHSLAKCPFWRLPFLDALALQWFGVEI